MASGIAIGLSLLAGATLGFWGVLVLAPALIAILALRRGHATPLIAIIATCMLLGAARGTSGPVVNGSALPGDTRGARGVVASLPVAAGGFERAILRVEQVLLDDDEWANAIGDVIVFLPENTDRVSWRDEVFVIWDFEPVAELPPGFGRWVRGQGAIGSATVFTQSVVRPGPGVFDWLSEARRSVSGALEHELPGDPGALASGFVTGDDSALSDEAEQAFLRTGTRHLTSVSGQNVALLMSFMTLWYTPRGKIQRVIINVLMLVVVWTFVVMVGLEPPALRAAVVSTLVILGTLSGRRPDPLTLLALTLGVMTMIDPRMPHSVGFWLSASASLALCSVMQPEAPAGIRGKARNVIAASIAASLGTMPILVWSFHEWSPVTPLANALLSPIMTVLFPVVYLYAGAALFLPGLAEVLSWVPGIGLDATLSIVERLAVVAGPIPLDTGGPGGALMIGVPCVLAIWLMGRESGRWIRIAERAT